MQNYLIAVLILFALWGIVLLFRKDVREALVWGGGAYALLVVPIAFLVKALGKEAESISALDVVFMFFVGSFAATAYEVFSPHKIKNTKKRHHIISVLVFLASYLAIAFFLPWDPAWRIAASCVAGWVVMVIQRRDLLGASMGGAIAFLTVYAGGFLLYHMATGEVAWNLKNLSVVVYPFPLKEILRAFAIGLMWTPLYEYMTGKSIA